MTHTHLTRGDDRPSWARALKLTALKLTRLALTPLALTPLALTPLTAPAFTYAAPLGADAGLLSDLPPGFTLTPPDAPYSFRAGVMSQNLATERWGGSFSQSHTESLTQLRFRTPFELRSAPRASGAFTRAFFQAEWIKSPTLIDAELELRWSQAVGVMFGRYRSFFSRNWRTVLPVLMSPGRGETIDAFRPERAFGATVFGELLDHKVEYALAAQDMGEVDAQAPRAPLYVAHAVFNPLGATPYTQTPWFGEVSDLRVAIGGSAMVRQGGAVSTDVSKATFGAELTVLHPRFAWLSEAFEGEVRNAAARVEGRGFYTQVGAPLVARTLDAHLRYSLIKPLRLGGAPLGDVGARTCVEVSVGYYLAGNRAKVVLHYQRSEGVDPTKLTDLASAPSQVDQRLELFAQLAVW